MWSLYDGEQKYPLVKTRSEKSPSATSVPPGSPSEKSPLNLPLGKTSIEIPAPPRIDGIFLHACFHMNFLPLAGIVYDSYMSCSDGQDKTPSGND